MRFMQTESLLQTKNQSEPAKNWSVALLLVFFTSENNFLKYACYFINSFLYFINLYIIKIV